MFGSLIDQACVEWQGNCKRYDLPKLRSTFVVVSALSAVVSTIFFVAMKVLYVEPEAPVDTNNPNPQA